MFQSPQSAFESFLVEDMILTLGNLRGSLRWLGRGSEQERLAVERLDHQLGLLEDRARSMCRTLRDAAPSDGGNLFAPQFDAARVADDDGGSRGDIAIAILDALAGDADGTEQAAPLFRSRRA